MSPLPLPCCRCWVGWNRLSTAMQDVAEQTLVRFDVRWRAFLLDPAFAEGGACRLPLTWRGCMPAWQLQISRQRKGIRQERLVPRCHTAPACNVEPSYLVQPSAPNAGEQIDSYYRRRFGSRAQSLRQRLHDSGGWGPDAWHAASCPTRFRLSPCVVLAF